jgi:ribonuclease D
VREEIERTDLARAEYFSALRKALPDGDVRAAAELQRLVTRNRDSKNTSRHLLALARLYEDLAVEYVEANPPHGLLFDPARFQELVDAASRLYETVAEQDGRPEKIEASRRLEAFLAFALRVDHDRFTP